MKTTVTLDVKIEKGSVKDTWYINGSGKASLAKEEKSSVGLYDSAFNQDTQTSGIPEPGKSVDWTGSTPGLVMGTYTARIQFDYKNKDGVQQTVATDKKDVALPPP